MTNWLQAVMAQASAVTDEQAQIFMPKKKRCSHQTVVGALDTDLKALHFLYRQNDLRGDELMAELSTCAAGERDNIALQCRRHFTQAEALKNMFWASCFERYPELYGKPEVGLYADWELCWADHDKAFMEGFREGLASDSESDQSGPRVRISIVGLGSFGTGLFN